MAIITTEEMTYLAKILGDSYQDGLDGYGDINTPGSLTQGVSKAKVFVRGGAEARNGIRSNTVSNSGSVLDLEPTVSSKTVTVRRGQFYLNGKLNELYNNRSFSFAFDEDFWLSAGMSGATWSELKTDLAGNTAKTITAQKCYAHIYASDEPINDATAGDMDSYTDFSATHADARIASGTKWIAAQFMPTASTSSVNLDKVKLYITSTGSPNTGLICDVYEDSTGTPSTVVFSSFQVDNIDADGSWVDFVFEDPSALTGGNDYWLVLRPGTPSGGAAANLSGSIYYDWHFKSAAYANGSTDAIKLSTNSGSGWGGDIGGTGGGGSGLQPAMQFISYLKVAYSGIVGVWGSTDVPSTLSTFPNTLGYPTPAKRLSTTEELENYASVAKLILTSNSGAYSAGSIPITSTVTLTDSREIVGYQGLEDDDKMAILFPGIEATENEVLKVTNGSTTNPVATSYSATVSALQSHISQLSTSSTFKTYWRDNAVYFNTYSSSRPFRQIWYANAREELIVEFGRFTADGNNAAVFPSRYTSQNEYAVNLTTGVNLEVYNPEITTGEISLRTFGITTTYTTMTAELASGATKISVADGSLFAIDDYIWVQTWNGANNGEILKVKTVTGNVIDVSTGESGVCGAATLSNHYVLDRVYLIDDITTVIASATAAGTQTALTPTVSTTKFVGCAFAQPTYSGAKYGGSGNAFVIRNA